MGDIFETALVWFSAVLLREKEYVMYKPSLDKLVLLYKDESLEEDEIASQLNSVEKEIACKAFVYFAHILMLFDQPHVSKAISLFDHCEFVYHYVTEIDEDPNITYIEPETTDEETTDKDTKKQTVNEEKESIKVTTNQVTTSEPTISPQSQKEEQHKTDIKVEEKQDKEVCKRPRIIINVSLSKLENQQACEPFTFTILV